ncbi:MAG: hypothetical protein UR80_C0019G0009 [Parcubacteria group bacterium GW2011_GWB1_35_5]|nr:MAG: hypothetical protein UR50_C0001G0041 [Parcubacteria group bacterium GW2011_GWC1_34_10]KKP80777.1 MAG: hypothetical protein UR80_C0019G0009 [Parcubacteria group bacterium GW2011_GWB1_35_5]
MIKISKRTIEKLSHLNCIFCKKWWTVGDASPKKKKWFCPWCGKSNEYKK